MQQLARGWLIRGRWRASRRPCDDLLRAGVARSEERRVHPGAARPVRCCSPHSAQRHDRAAPAVGLRLQRARPTHPALPGRGADHRALSGLGHRHGVGLDITVQSTNGMLDFGYIADRDLVPDLWATADRTPGALADLSDAAGVTLDAADRAG